MSSRYRPKELLGRQLGEGRSRTKVFEGSTGGEWRRGQVEPDGGETEDTRRGGRDLSREP